MKVFILTIVSLAFSITTIAQDKNALKYANTITAEEISEHLHIIASDEFEGRETGKAGQKMAMEYLIEQFRSYGIEDYEGLDYQQSFPLIEQQSKGVSLQINGSTFELNKDFTISPAIINQKNISTDIVFVGYGIENKSQNDYTGIDVQEKAVFFWAENPSKKLNEEWTISKKIELAKEKGATAIFFYDKALEKNLEQYEHYFNKPKTKLLDDVKNTAPIVRLTKNPTNAFLKAGKLTIKKIEKKGLKKYNNFSSFIRLNIDKPTEELTGENVIAYIEGSDKSEELIVLTAHYDHIGKDDSLIYNGADDDGTGTVSLLEIAQAFSQAAAEGHQPKRSILIMPVSGEEKGLLGSKYYTNHPIFPLENTVANLNIDMIGRYDKNHEEGSNYIYLIGSDKLSSELHRISEGVNHTYTQFELDYTFNDDNDPNRFYYRSDHYNFAKNNIPVIFYFSGVHEDYHKSTDTVEKIDFEKTARVAQLVFLTAWELANRQDRIQLDKEINN